MLNAVNLISAILISGVACYNIVLDLGWPLVMGCIAFGSVALFLYFRGRYRGASSSIVLPTLVNLMCMAVLGFIFNGGTNGGSQYFFAWGMACCIMISPVHWHWRIILFCALALTAVLILEWIAPQVIVGYPDPFTRWLDVWTSIILALGGLGFTVSILRRNFNLYRRMLEVERGRSIRLLKNAMPGHVVQALLGGQRRIHEEHKSVTVLFADIVGFTRIVAESSADDVIPVLDALFMEFDDLATKLGIQKIKTIGDAYMAVAGLPGTREDHADACLRFSTEAIRIASKSRLLGEPVMLRIGLHSGPVIGGVIGRNRTQYDLWGNTVNVASRLQALAEPGTILFGDSTRDLLADTFGVQPLGHGEIKGVGSMRLWSFVARE